MIEWRRVGSDSRKQSEKQQQRTTGGAEIDGEGKTHWMWRATARV
jgi:hypothetical protein